MEQKNMKIFVWIIVIIVGLGVIALIIGGVNHFNEVSKVVDEIKVSSTFDEIISVHEKYADEYFGREERVERALDEITYNYLKENYSNINGICLPYYTSLQSSKMKISPNYKMIILYIKDLNNVYILPSDLICKIDQNSDNSNNVIFNELYYDISNNVVKIENIANADNYKFKITGSTASDIITEKNITIPSQITYFLDSVNNEKGHLWLSIDEYNNIDLYDLNESIFSDDNHASSNYYITTPNFFKIENIAKEENIKLTTPSISIQNNSVLFTYNIGNDETIANNFFHKYQEYLKQYYKILPKEDTVYVYADEIVAAVKCGQDDTGYFMMMSFNYNDKYYSSGNSSNNSSNSSYKSNSSTSRGCQYKYSNGSICGKTVGTHSPLCDYHFYELDSTYKYFTGK